jgi:hypothetical protein
MLDRLPEALDVVAAADPATLADPEAILALHRNLAQMEAVTTRAVAEFEASREYHNRLKHQRPPPAPG